MRVPSLIKLTQRSRSTRRRCLAMALYSPDEVPFRIIVVVDPIITERPVGYAYIDFNVEREYKAIARHRRLVLRDRWVNFIKEGTRIEPVDEVLPAALNWKRFKRVSRK